MKRHVLLLSLIFLVFGASAQHNGWRPGEMELKVSISCPADAAKLYNLKLDTEPGTGFAWVYATPEEFNNIKASGLKFQITVKDLNTHFANYWNSDVPSGYYTWAQIRDIADSLATNFPSICRKYTFGFSADGNELAALKISDNAGSDENEAEIMFDGGIHGDEVGGSQNIITFARKLCLSYGDDPYITSLVDNREIWLYYCVNPDGRINMSRYNGNGVDINRDFGYMWDGEGNSNTAFSQPESRALRNCAYDNQFVVYTNYHSGTEYLSYPWSYRASPAPDKPSINDLASRYASSSGYSNLPYGQGYTGMYPINGSTKDFNYGSLGSVAWSIEISLDKQPPASQISYYYSLNEPAMFTMIEYAGYGLEGIITDSTTGFPVKAAIFVGNNFPVYSDDSVGDYHKYIIPGTYSLRVTANGYKTKIISNVSVTALNSTVTNIQMQRQPGQFAYKVTACSIPGNNEFDPGYTAACLGPANQENYSLGKGGYIILDMQNPVNNGSGDDIVVHEGDANPEGYTVYVSNSKDGPWVWLGVGNGTTNFDLSIPGVPNVQFLKIIDDNNGTAGSPAAGFDLDAVEALYPYQPDSIGTINGIIYDNTTGLVLEGAWVNSGTHTTLSDADGNFILPALEGKSIVVCSGKNLYAPECDTLEIHGGQTVIHDFRINPNTSVFSPQPVKTKIWAEPNPFKACTVIKIKGGELFKTAVEISNVEGMPVTRLFPANISAGESTLLWDGTDNRGNPLPGGVYFCRLIEGGCCNLIKIVLIR